MRNILNVVAMNLLKGDGAESSEGYAPLRTSDFDEEAPLYQEEETENEEILFSQQEQEQHESSLRSLESRIQSIGDLSLRISDEIDMQRMEVDRLDAERDDIEHESQRLQRAVRSLLRSEEYCSCSAIVTVIVILTILIVLKYLYEHDVLFKNKR